MTRGAAAGGEEATQPGVAGQREKNVPREAIRNSGAVMREDDEGSIPGS